jgi:hypothetical protein
VRCRYDDILNMRPRVSKPRQLLPIYLALVVLGSIVAHLASEFFAMGSEADSVALSPKHLYLGVGALIALVVAIQQTLAMWRRSAGGRDFKRELHLGLASLPFRGRGPFFALTAGLQLSLGLLTQVGEGCPFCGHDIAAGIIGAALTVVFMGLASWAIGRRLPSIAAAIAAFFVVPAPRAVTLVASRDRTPLGLPRFIWFSQLYNRPPPSLSIA